MVMIMSHRSKQQEQKQHKRGETSLNLLSNTAIWKSIVEHTKPTDKSTTATTTTTTTTTTTPPVLLTPPRPKNKAITSTISITSASGAEKISSSSSSLQCSAKAVIAPSFDSTCSSTAATAMTTAIAASRSGADAASRNTASPNTAVFLSPNQQQQQHAVIPVIPLSSSFSSLSNFSSPVTQTTAYNESDNNDSGSCPTSLVVRDVAQQVEAIFNTNNNSSLLPFQQLSASISKDSAAAAKAHTMTREQQHNNIHLPSYEDIVRGALELEQQSALKDQTILSLREKVKSLETKIEDLRQLPTKKISQILVEDMLEIMQIYGSEHSETSMPPRKNCIQRSSVVRQFRRWNPNFFEYFEYRSSEGKWVPKLGKQGELERRKELRSRNAKSRRSKTPASRARSPALLSP